MDNKNSLISFLTEQKILDDRTLQSVIDKHEKTGQSLITILKKDVEDSRSAQKRQSLLIEKKNSLKKLLKILIHS